METETTAAPTAGKPTTARGRKDAAASEAIKLLPALIDALRWGQLETAANVGDQLARTLEQSHGALASRIQKRIPSPLQPKRMTPLPHELLEMRTARHGLAEVILPASVEQSCLEILREHDRAAELASFDLAPRHKVLLYGPPGNGKTLLAEGLAKELDVPFLPVKYAGLIESFMGQTGKNLQTIFDFAATAPCVIFMDEFDAIAMDRADSKDVGEIRRVTNQMLLKLDQLPTTCVFIGATNAAELLDRAVFRRFDFVVELPAPTADLKLRCAQRELSTSRTPGFDVSALATQVAALHFQNLSALVQLCQRIRRDLVLNQGQGVQAILTQSQSQPQ